MKKILIILIASLTMVGCTNIENDYKSNNQEIPKLTDSDIRGIWDNVVPIENGDWYISSYYFYGNNKCSISAVISTSSGINTLANEECSYRISDLNIYIDGSLSFRYDEYNKNLVRINNSEIKYIKTDDDPCVSTYSHC